jgi:hypothetical protein
MAPFIGCCRGAASGSLAAAVFPPLRPRGDVVGFHPVDLEVPATHGADAALSDDFRQALDTINRIG